MTGWVLVYSILTWILEILRLHFVSKPVCTSLQKLISGSVTISYWINKTIYTSTIIIINTLTRWLTLVLWLWENVGPPPVPLFACRPMDPPPLQNGTPFLKILDSAPADWLNIGFVFSALTWVAAPPSEIPGCAPPPSKIPGSAPVYMIYMHGDFL